MARRFLIDRTDERVKTDENRAVIDYIRRMNPYAHSDVADRLIESAHGLTDVHVYCPAPVIYAFVVLHTITDRIFAIAYGQRGLAFRLPGSVVAEAMADGGTVYRVIGTDWVSFHPWPVEVPTVVTKERLNRWCAIASRHAVGEPA